MVSATPSVPPAKSFPRSDTVVSNDEVVIGERHFSVREIMSADVWDITAGKHLVVPMHREKAQRFAAILLPVAAFSTIVALFLDGQSLWQQFFRGLYTVTWGLYLLMTVLTVPGYRPFFKKHAYYLTLNTVTGPEDVITSFDLKYIDEIAKEINLRCTGSESLVRQQV